MLASATASTGALADSQGSITMYYQRLSTKTKTSPVKIAMFLEKDLYMPEHSLYVPTTPKYWENHKKVYRNITNPQDVEARKHGWCDFVVRNNKIETFQYFKFLERGDPISIGMIEKWKGLPNNHQVVIFDHVTLGYVKVSMDYFSQHYETFTSKETMEIRSINNFIPSHIGHSTLNKNNFNNITHSKVLNIISHTEILPHEYLKYHKSTNGSTYVYKNNTFYSLKCLYDFIKPATISYERFRHVYSSFGIEKIKAKEVSSYGSPSVSANALPIKSEDSIFDMDGLKRSEAPKEQITNEKNISNAKENNCTYVSVDDKRSGHEYYKIRAEITTQLLTVLDRNYVEEITMKPDFYDCYVK